MDTNMEMDLDYDIDLGVDNSNIEEVEEAQSIETTLVQNKQTEDGNRDIPAAYYDDLETTDPVPEYINLQGVNDFGPDDPLGYAYEHCPDIAVKKVRWINDESLNLEYGTAEDAIIALRAFTQSEAQADSFPAQEARQAKPYSKKPDVVLLVRESNTGDRKEKDAARRSHYYKNNPQPRNQGRGRGRERQRERSEPRRVFLDYGDSEVIADRRESFDESMNDESSSANEAGRRRSHFRNNDRGKPRDPANVDRYIPDAESHVESRFGRLRGRSASPQSSEDGRYGFGDEAATSPRYRSRSRERRRSRSREPWRRRYSGNKGYSTRTPPIDLERNRWQKDPSAAHGLDSPGYAKERMGNHRRSDAMDQTDPHMKGSLLDRMTKNGRPVASKASLMSRMTKRDGAPVASLASRITRGDDESSYGRLKDDYSEPQENFAEVAPKRPSLLSRMTRDDDSFSIRGRASSQDSGFGIRGAAPNTSGFSIKGAAGGD